MNDAVIDKILPDLKTLDYSLAESVIFFLFLFLFFFDKKIIGF